MLALGQSILLTNIELAGAVDGLLQLGANGLGERLTGIIIDPVGDSLAGVVADEVGHCGAVLLGQADALLDISGAVHELRGPALERTNRVGHRRRVALGQTGFRIGVDRAPEDWH